MSKVSRRIFASVVLALMIMMSPLLMTKSMAMEDLGGTPSQSNGTGLDMGSIDEDDLKVGDIIKQHRGMTGDQFESASKTLSPVTNIFGCITGGILVLIFGAVFCITALDLLYISIPPIRNILYKAPMGGAAGGGMPMGGMGYGGRYGGMGMGASMNQGMAQEAKPVRWISDEAVQCVAMLENGGAQPQPMGGMGMGGMGMAQQNPQQNMSMKSVIGMYFRKRIWFMVMLAVSAIVLTSSVLLGTGINIGQWFIRMVNMVNGNIPS